MKKIREIYFLPKDANYDEMDSPVGKLTLIASSNELHAILWDVDRKQSQYAIIINRLKKSKDAEIIVQTRAQLNEYFQGTRQEFDLPLVINGTDFQIQAWTQLLKIPYATTISYASQAEKIGNKNKARAVGMANALNPIPIIIPCHRVIGSNGQLVGFGGGIMHKQWLLEHEKKNRK